MKRRILRPFLILFILGFTVFTLLNIDEYEYQDYHDYAVFGDTETIVAEYSHLSEEISLGRMEHHGEYKYIYYSPRYYSDKFVVLDWSINKDLMIRTIITEKNDTLRGNGYCARGINYIPREIICIDFRGDSITFKVDDVFTDRIYQKPTISVWTKISLGPLFGAKRW